MKRSRFLPVFAALLLFASVVMAADKPASQDSNATAKILPKEFGGWQLSGVIQKSSDPQVADPVNASVLKEYGFNNFESATYTRDDGRKLKIKAARFTDASGAYGSFTFYKMPQMLSEQIGDQGASLNERVLVLPGKFPGRCELPEPFGDVCRGVA